MFVIIWLGNTAGMVWVSLSVILSRCDSMEGVKVSSRVYIHSNIQVWRVYVHSSLQVSRVLVHSSLQVSRVYVHSSLQVWRVYVHSNLQVPRVYVHSGLLSSSSPILIFLTFMKRMCSSSCVGSTSALSSHRGHVWQPAAVCCSVLQCAECAAVCCSVL